MTIHGHWRETWALIALLWWTLVALYLIGQLIGWLATLGAWDWTFNGPVKA
jgi:hypothetical protein